jgi:hypothetical protein
MVPAAFTARVRRVQGGPKVVLATHHKVLTTYLARVFRGFARTTGRRFSFGSGDTVDYGADVLHDHHSGLVFEHIDALDGGLHVRRDPRDLLVSVAHYHQVAAEPWLHVPRSGFGGRSYQEHVKAMASIDEVLAFEIDHSGGRNIRAMLDWDYESSPLTELRYEDLVGDDGPRRFREAVDPWALSNSEKKLLVELFDYFSVRGAPASRSSHIRDPRSGQWVDYFTDDLRARFDAAFPDAAPRLGY